MRRPLRLVSFREICALKEEPVLRAAALLGRSSVADGIGRLPQPATALRPCPSGVLPLQSESARGGLPGLFNGVLGYPACGSARGTKVPAG